MRYSTIVKTACVGFLILVLMIPAGQVGSLIGERQQRRDAAIKEMQSSWSGAQVVNGPLLRVPVRLSSSDSKGRITTVTRELFLLPDDLDIKGDLRTDTRRRGIYSAVLYTAKLDLKGSFTPPDLEKLDLAGGVVQWDRAVFLLGVSDLRGVKGGGTIEWAGRTVPLEVGDGAVSGETALTAAVNAEPLAASSHRAAFSLSMDLLGSQSLRLVPVGKTTSVALKSPWASPSFRGAFLPESREVGPAGFTARWQILHLNRNLPSAAVDGAPTLASSEFGLDLLVPIDQYASVDRAVKYELLFVFLTFLVFFFIEHFQARQLHPIQYLLVGAGIVLFYLLLLSFSEHMPFAVAYLLASLSIVSVIGGYAQGVFGRGRVTATVSGFLSGLYAYLYTLLRLEDYALLLGSLGLLLALAIVMYLTRGFDWYASERRVEETSSAAT